MSKRKRPQTPTRNQYMDLVIAAGSRWDRYTELHFTREKIATDLREATGLPCSPATISQIAEKLGRPLTGTVGGWGGSRSPKTTRLANVVCDLLRVLEAHPGMNLEERHAMQKGIDEIQEIFSDSNKSVA